MTENIYFVFQAAVCLPKESITPLLCACLPRILAVVPIISGLSVGIAAEHSSAGSLQQQPNYRKPFNRGRSTPNTYHRSEIRL